MPFKNVEDRNRNARENYQKNRDHYRSYRNKWVKDNSNKVREELAGRPRPEKCEVCSRSSAGRSKDHGTVWDHNHQTGLFRGWICGKCNSILGFCEDNPETLRRLANYLENDGIVPVAENELVYAMDYLEKQLETQL